VTGTVEEINLRTTRIRTVGNSVVMVPNAVFATASIENITKRNRILHRQTVRLALVTSESTIRSVLQGLREMLVAIDKVSEESSRVRLIGDEFLAIAEDINLGTIATLEKVGARIAEPPR